MVERGFKNILVTGASTGIGLALVKELKKDTHFRIIATARNESLHRFQEQRLNESESLIFRQLEICDYQKSTALIEEIEKSFGGVDVLINNAGVSYRSVVEHMTPEAEHHQMMVNYLGAIHLTRCAIPGMRKKRSGHIINISSVGGMMAMPTMSSYSASKFALEGASESLWYELKPWGISVSIIEPGFVRSNSFRRVLMPEAAKTSLEDSSCAYHAYYNNMTAFVEKLMLDSHCTPEKIAKKIIKTMKAKNPPLRVPGGADARFFSLLRRVMPRRLYHWFLYRNLPNIKEWEKEIEHL